MLKAIGIQTAMKPICTFRIALMIAAALFCGGLARAQDANSSWLLSAHQFSSLNSVSLSTTHIDFARLQSPTPTSQSPNAADSGAAAHAPQTPAPEPTSTANYSRSDEHRFWDATNDWLFAGVGASRTLDYFSTLNMRHRGRDEILLTNDVVDNHAAFAVIEAAGTGASIGVSYIFHHYGHHKLERATSIVHIGLATTGAVRNYCLKTAHPATAQPASASALVPVVPALIPGLAPIAGAR
jgi:hypothetical protein